MESRCEICRQAENLGKHVTENLVRGERRCNDSASDQAAGWIFLCAQCHGSVHRLIEDHPEIPGIQSDAVSQVIERLERAFLGGAMGRNTTTGKEEQA